MITTDFTQGNHDWKKVNLIGICGRKGVYDLYKCTKCGLEAKSYSFGVLQLQEKNLKKLRQCSVQPTPKRIQIIECRACGSQFQNLLPGSVHDIIIPPPGQNNLNGEWVMGVGEPVKVLFKEFIYLNK